MVGQIRSLAWCLFGVGFWRAPGKDLFAGKPDVSHLPKCSGDSDGNDCLTAKQIAAIERIRADISSQGEIIFPGRPIGTEIDSIATNAPNPHLYFAENFFRYMAFPEQDPKYDLAQFDFDKDPGRMTPIRQMMNATDSDLSQVQSRGGKIIMYHGWGDPGLNPRMSVAGNVSLRRRCGRRSL